tara:strand:+ start:407 stop:610 length:204 start_codon:yes stop_codon:yes gene_type:complete
MVKKRKPGRPRLINPISRKAITLRDDVIERLDTAMGKHNNTLPYTLNRQQFMEVLITSWEQTSGEDE